MNRKQYGWASLIRSAFPVVGGAGSRLPSSKSWHRRAWFCLLTFMVFVFVASAALLCLWTSQEKEYYRRQHRVLTELRQRDDNCVVLTEPVNSSWLKRFIPEEGLYRIVEVQFLSEDLSREILELAAALPSVDHMEFMLSPVNDQDLAGFRKSRIRLMRLGLSCTKISDQGVECFKNVRELTRLNLAATQVHGECMRAFWGSSLTSLTLTQTRIDDDSLRWLEGLDTLEALSLGENRINGSGLRHIARLKRLQVLDLSKTAVDDSAMSFLEDLQEIQCLYLNSTSVSDSGVAHLRNMQHLEILTLDNTSVGDAAIEVLWNIKSLRELNLAGTLVTDEGLKPLAKMSGLECLYLSDKRITVSGLSELRKAHPRLKVDVSTSICPGVLDQRGKLGGN